MKITTYDSSRPLETARREKMELTYGRLKTHEQIDEVTSGHLVFQRDIDDMGG